MTMTEIVAPSEHPRPVVLCILDGWGERAETADNAIALGHTPNWDRFMAKALHARLDASAEDVGLPAGQMGNSEVGHMNIGAGRVVLQVLPRIDAALADGSLATSPALTRFIDKVKTSGGTCHLMGLLSLGGVHSHQVHMAYLVRQLAAAGVPVQLHAFLDGRDTPPKSGREYMESFLADVADLDGFRVATVSGRYYAMDRDKRWERVEKAYRALAEGDGERADDASAAIAASYTAGVTDEFMLPTVIGDHVGITATDGVLMANFRADRVREILTALADPDFLEFPRKITAGPSHRLGMIEYSGKLNDFYETLFGPLKLTGILGGVIAEAGLKQLRIAESEKYAHVTYFLNGGREEKFPGEQRVLVPSPRVATYDLQPEMSAPEVTDNLINAVESGSFDLIVVNYANGDMVGHTGILEAAIVATEVVDICLGQLATAVTEAGGVLLVTADHGNCEMMNDPTLDGPHTAHTTNVVPVVMVDAPSWVQGLRDGRLCDVAPTVLKLMGLEQPVEMTGCSLINDGRAKTVAEQ